MKAKIFKTIVIAGIFISSLVYAQQPTVEWLRTYHGPANGGGISKVITDNNNDIIVTGKNAGSSIALDIATIKYNSAGDSLWVRRYSSGAESSIDGIAVDASNNIYITGFTVIGGQPKSITIKYDPSGNIIWQKLYDSTPDNRSIGVGIDEQGFVYIAGSANKNGVDWGVEVVKYNPANGDTIWTTRYDQTSNSIDIPYAMTVDNSGNVCVTGYSQAAGIIKAMLIKFNSIGQFQWETLYNIPSVTGEIQGRAIDVDTDGNIYVAGHCYNGQATFVDFLILKCNSNGDTAWVKTYSNSFSTDEAKDIAIDNEGNVYVTGKTFVGGGGSNNYDYLTVKLSPSGNVLWHSIYDGPAGHTQDEARAIVLNENGYCFVTGGSSVSSLYYSGDFATVMYDANGNQVWTIRNTSGDFGAYDIAIDNFNNLYLGGGQTANFCTIKINSGVVPVELISFDFILNGNQVTLNWSTASETNNRGFEVERKIGGRQSAVGNLPDGEAGWEKIGYVEGNGTTTETKEYLFTDENLASGSYNYRLKQIDFDGSFEYSNTVEVSFMKPAVYSLEQNYPNPFNPQTKIKFVIPEESFVTIKVYDVLGNEISTLVSEVKEAGKYELLFSADNLSTGLYFYVMESGNFKGVNKMLLIK